MIEIENGIPVPRTRAGRPCVYPLADMGIGQSFFMPSATGKTALQMQHKISGSISNYSKKTGERFATRIVDDGVRVWRIA